MKKIILGFFFFLYGTLYAQNNTIRDANGNNQTTTKPDVIKIENYLPISIEDPRITITDVSVDRRFSPDGKGEIMDIFFNIDNNLSESIDVYIWVLAYYETDAVDKEERKIVPYPEWRVMDPDKRFFITRFIKITPKDIPPEKVWTPEDPDYKKYHQVIERMRNAVGHMKVISDIYPPVWKYVSYIMRYPTQGIPAVVYGDQGPTLDKLLFTNYVPPTPEEKTTKIFKHIPDHSFTINYSRRRTIVRSHHYTPYKANFKFFNMFRILIFDANKAKQYEEQASRELKEGEIPVESIMYHRIFYLNKDIKIR